MAEPFPTRSGWNPRYGWDSQTGPPQGQGYGATAPGMTYNHPVAYPSQPYAWPQHNYAGVTPYPAQRLPQVHPQVSGDFPGMNMVNSTGGAGCEPGYNYIFHNEHTKIHVLKTPEPPWRAPVMHVDFAKFHVPTNTTVAELMMCFGAMNPVPALNKITEVWEGGNGQWYRGMILMGDNEVVMKKTLRELGWDASRSGREKAVVWLWVTKD
ncbi:hypothetical protein GGS21DRAFT_376136 [Xylaria nigripes]|nr:hypothetical protein GGS21DRAFT_376136 [Xylaria nigripes]